MDACIGESRKSIIKANVIVSVKSSENLNQLDTVVSNHALM